MSQGKKRNLAGYIFLIKKKKEEGEGVGEKKIYQFFKRISIFVAQIFYIAWLFLFLRVCLVFREMSSF